MIAGGKNNLIGISGKIGSGKDTAGKILQYLSSFNKYSNSNIKTLIEEDNATDIYPHFSNYQIKKYADKLKYIVCLIIGCTREQLEDREFKEKELGEDWRQYFNDDNYDLVCKKESTFSSLLTPRKILQLLGTEAGRQIIHPNIWVNALFADYEDVKINNNTLLTSNPPQQGFDLIKPNWIITDVRFPNEAQAIKDRGGIVIRVDRDYVSYENVENEYSILNKLRSLYLSSEVCAGEYLENVSFDSNIPHSLVQKGIDLFLEWDGSEESFTYIQAHPSETSLDDYEFDHVIDNNGSIDELIEKVKQLKLV